MRKHIKSREPDCIFRSLVHVRHEENMARGEHVYALLVISTWTLCLHSLLCSATDVPGIGGGSCEQPDAEVLILGAGMAGIAAAYGLQQNGTKDFIILEAQDRIGGRMRTETFAGIHVNAGAAWMQGVDPADPSR